MARNVKFIHAADVHLGAPVGGLCNVAPDWSPLLLGAIAKAWDRVVNAALANDVDFVLLAGDLFDTSRPSYGDYLLLFRGLERLDEAGIPTYLVTGNHDPYTSWERELDRLPASTLLLGVNGPEFELFSRDDDPLCIIGGRSYYNQAWPEGESIAAGIGRREALVDLARRGVDASRAAFMVGMVHTGLVPDQSKAAIDLRELLAADVDYWACGHLHENRVFPDSANPRVSFPGCIQGRTIDEVGERGCYLVELSETEGAEKRCRAEVKLIPTSSVVFQQVSVDVSACRTLADIRGLVQAELFHENGKTHCDEMVTRITLTGETSLHRYFLEQDVLSELRQQINNAYPAFFCDTLLDKTRFPGESGGGAEGPFAEIVGAMANDQRLREDVLINYVQSEFVKRGIVVPSTLTQMVGELGYEAEQMVMDLLRRDSQ